MNTIYIENIEGLTSEIAKSSTLINMLRGKYKLCLQGFIRVGDTHTIVCKTDIKENIINLFMDNIVIDINNIIKEMNSFK